jgi:hypothetical protein
MMGAATTVVGVVEHHGSNIPARQGSARTSVRRRGG